MHDWARLAQAGRWDLTGWGPPCLDPGDREMIARRAFWATGLEPGCDPRWLAVRLDFRVMTGRVSCVGGEATESSIIAYSPKLAGDRRRVAVAHGLAHGLLCREGWRHSETDAWLLTTLLLSDPRNPLSL